MKLCGLPSGAFFLCLACLLSDDSTFTTACLPEFNNCTNNPTGCCTENSGSVAMDCYVQTQYYSQCLTACPSDWTNGCASPEPTFVPTVTPRPSPQPTVNPTSEPTALPSHSPTRVPTSFPTSFPTPGPTRAPTRAPTQPPSLSPTSFPTTPAPSAMPTPEPSSDPTPQPTPRPTPRPSLRPTATPTQRPTHGPTTQPTPVPTTSSPTTPAPSEFPTSVPSHAPTRSPTPFPTPLPTFYPTHAPTRLPTAYPTSTPTHPTAHPTVQPTGQPSTQPTGQPTKQPSTQPTAQPSISFFFANTTTPSPTESPGSNPTGSSGSGSTTGNADIAMFAVIPLVILLCGGGAFYRYSKRKETLLPTRKKDRSNTGGSASGSVGHIELEDLYESGTMRDSEIAEMSLKLNFQRTKTMSSEGPVLETSYMLPFSALTMDEVPIAAGGGGQVYRGKYAKMDVAIKSVYSQMMHTTNTAELAHEASMMASIHHPNFIRLFGLSRKGPYLYVVTEWVPMTLLQALEREDYDMETMCHLGEQILSGIDFIHQQDICHRDIKPQNILVTEKMQVKICDLGMSRFSPAGKEKTMTAGMGTPLYMPKEVFDTGAGGEARYDASKWDAYSLAIILWTLWYRKEPFANLETLQLIHAVLTQNIRPPFEEPEPPQAYQDLITSMWDVDPDNRPTVAQALTTFQEVVQRTVRGLPSYPHFPSAL